jgi:hypothetical protein
MPQNNEFVEEKENTEIECYFRLQTGGLIDTTYLQAVELPKFSMSLFINKQQKLNERSPITLTFSGIEACAQLCSASRKVFKEFQIEFLDEKMNVKNTWEFINAHIKAIDLGSISKEMGISEPTVLCEIDFENLKIGNTII